MCEPVWARLSTEPESRCEERNHSRGQGGIQNPGSDVAHLRQVRRSAVGEQPVPVRPLLLQPGLRRPLLQERRPRPEVACPGRRGALDAWTLMPQVSFFVPREVIRVPTWEPSQVAVPPGGESTFVFARIDGRSHHCFHNPDLILHMFVRGVP